MEKTPTKVNPGADFPVVGLGASAGGLDALQRFLAKLPQDYGFALVFIQHLSSKHKSLLHEILKARRPSLVIQEISDGLKVQPGRLYVSPPGREVRLRNGLFQTTVHPEGLIHLPIDEFLTSLAENAAERSIAVIFSGAGTDGARGCQAVRSAGGTVFVQDPETAEFNSMPLAAIATGRADAVLSPEDIAAELLKLQRIGQAAVGSESPITPEEYDGFFRILQEKIGTRFAHYKKNVVSRRIRRRMYLHGLATIKAYLDLISADDHEASLLASDLMIGVTSFFRDRLAWKVLNAEAVRKIAAEDTTLPVRVWTPATATGEEAYSIAIMLLRELDLAGKKRDLHVFATDVNDRALERAREGRYPASITADVPQEYIQKYFTSTDDGNVFVINKDVRECVVFARQDLLTDPPFSKLDLIICRNFLIYLEPEAQEKCMMIFHYALNNGGYLFLGNAETAGKRSAFFKSIGRKQCRIYRKLETKPASRLPLSVPFASERTFQQSAKQAQIVDLKKSLTEIIQEKLLEEYAPASVAVDQNHEIIYHNGPTNRYLRQPRGVPTQNLLELVPENLRSRIRGALYRSAREEQPVVIRTSVAGDDNKKRHVTLRITKAAENLFIMVFQEKRTPSTREAAEQVNAAVIEETAIHQLEGELSATRADLQSHIEQLKSLNEELQSSNEEMQAANEELETSREELQSLNEELLTVNSQLQCKIEEQDATNNDLNNFFASTNIPTIFLDTDFSVKRFTPAMLKLIKLLPTDVGRPIIDMSQENLGPDLLADAKAVLGSLVAARQEMLINGEWYVRATLPYRTADNRIEGVVVTYNDVSELKKSEARTRHLASFPEINPNPICEVNSSGKIIFCNPATEKVLINLGMGAEDVTVFLPDDIDGILRDLEKQEEVSLYREKVIGDRVFGMTVHLAPQFNVVRIYAYDITERKGAEEELKNSEELFRLAVNNMPGALGIYDAERRYKFVNAAGLQRLGKPLESLIGRRIDEMYDEEQRKAFWPSLMRAYETGEPQIVECTIDWPTGRYDLIITFVPMLKDGQVYQVLNFTYDITERKKAEEAVIRSKQTFLELIERAPFGIYTVDSRFRIAQMNVGSQDGAFRNVRPVIGRDFAEAMRILWPEPVAVEIIAAFRHTLDTGEPYYSPRFTNPRHDAAIVESYEWELHRMTLPDGQYGVICYYFDSTKLREAEKALRLSEEKFSLAFANNAAAIAMTRLEDGLFLDVNDTWLALNGYSRDEVIGLSARKLPIWPSVEAATRFVQELRKKSSLRGWEQEFRRKSGEVFTAQLSAQILTVRGEQVILSTLVDITDRKRAEEALQKSEEQFRTLADSIPNLAWWANGDGYITWYNRRWYEYTGTTPEQMEGWGWQSVHDPEALPAVMERWKQSIATGDPFDMEFPLRGADGVFRPFLTRVLPLKDSDGLVLRWFGTNTDISAMRQTQEALRHSEERLRFALETSHTGAWDLNLLDHTAFRSLEHDRIFGYAELLPQWTYEMFIEHVLPEDRATVDAKFRGAMESLGDWGFECRIRRADGQVRWILAAGRHRPDASGVPNRMAGIVQDITERRLADEALRQSEEKYRSLFDNMIDGFAYHRIVLDEAGKPVDYIFLEVNDAFERLTGLKRGEISGRRVREVLPGIEDDQADWIGAYGRVALTGREERFEQYAAPLGKWYSVTAYCPRKEHFVTIFEDITERRQAEEALRESEERFRKMFERHRATMLLIEPETGAIVDANASAAVFYGRSIEELRSLTIQDINQLSADDVAAERHRALEEQRNYFVFPHKLASSQVRWVEVYSSPITVRGKPLLFSVIHDITERRLAEEALHRLNRTLQALTRSSRALLRATEETAYLQEICRIVVEDCGYAMVWVGFAEYDNARSVRPAAAAGFEAGYLDTLQLTWADTERGRGPTGTAIRTGRVAMCRNMQTDPQFAPWRAEAIKRGYSSSAVFPLLTDSRAFGALTVYSREPEGFGGDEVKLLTDLAGDFAYGITTLRLRAAHAAAEAALRESEARYRSLFESMLHGFAHCRMLYDESGRPSDFIYLDVNTAFGKMTGLKNVVGRRVTEVIPGIRDAHPEVFEICGRVALTGQPEKLESEFKPLGLWLSISVYSTVREHFVAIFDDITERKKAEASILILNDIMTARNLELESLNKELESFIYSVSHDLRAPIRAMSGFAKIINEDYADKLDAQGQDYVNRILNGSERSTQLINDLLRLSMISRQELSKLDVNLSKKASKIVEELRLANKDGNVEVVVQEGLVASADPRLIELVLSNLLGNAWKFTSKTEKARIEFGSIVKDGKPVYFVKDNGAGFDMTYADKMFLAFHRLHTDKEFEGTGIGLAIVERVIRRHGGRVWAEGELGKGATVFFTL